MNRRVNDRVRFEAALHGAKLECAETGDQMDLTPEQEKAVANQLKLAQERKRAERAPRV